MRALILSIVSGLSKKTPDAATENAEDGADHGKKIETVISIVAEAAMAIKSLLWAA